MLEKHQSDYWKSIKPGSTVTLSDTQTLEEAMKRGEGVAAQDYLVEKVMRIRQEENLAEWLIFKLQDNEDMLHLMVKMVDNEVDLRIYFQPEFDIFDPGNRKDLIESGEYWLFKEPSDPDNFKFDELEFTGSFLWTFIDEDDEDVDVEYEIKPQNVLQATVTYDPQSTGIDSLMATVIEYSATQDTDNPEALILETGGEDSDEGGWITLMFGCGVALTEVDVLHSA